MSATIFGESNFNKHVNNGAAVADSESTSPTVTASSVKDSATSSKTYPIAYGLIGVSVFSVIFWVAAVMVVLH